MATRTKSSCAELARQHRMTFAIVIVCGGEAKRKVTGGEVGTTIDGLAVEARQAACSLRKQIEVRR